MSQENSLTPEVAIAVAAIPGLRCEVGAQLAPHTTLRIGGPAALLASVDTVSALVALLRLASTQHFSLQLLGLGSNVLIPDEGLPGVTYRLAGEFKEIRVFGRRVRAGAAVPLAQLARRMSSQGLLGLEALSGFPSTLGGAVFMNAGCYGTEISESLESIEVIDLDGESRTLTSAELEPSYRSTRLQTEVAIVTAATLLLERGDAEAGLLRIAELNRRRHDSMPREANAGSVFRNPDGGHAGRLIDEAGRKGHRIGDAQISSRHANVVVNLGQARAKDVLSLMRLARDAVRASTGVVLEPELVLSGRLRSDWQTL